MSKSELETQVQLLTYQAFPRNYIPFHLTNCFAQCFIAHPHTKTKFFGIQGLSLDSILFKQPPAWDTASEKLMSFIDAVPNEHPTSQAMSESKHSLLKVVIPFLRTRFPKAVPGLTPKTLVPPPDVPYRLNQITSTFLRHLPTNDLFPLIDIWRMAVLDKAFDIALVSQLTPSGEILNASNTTAIPIIEILSKVNGGSGIDASSRNTLLTTLRLLSNAFSYQEGTGRYLLSSGPSVGLSPRSLLTTTLVSTLLHSDQAVRTAAASLAFNIASCIQKTRRNANNTSRESNGTDPMFEEDSDWEIEIISAIVEVIKLEDANEDIGEFYSYYAFVFLNRP